LKLSVGTPATWAVIIGSGSWASAAAWLSSAGARAANRTASGSDAAVAMATACAMVSGAVVGAVFGGCWFAESSAKAAVVGSSSTASRHSHGHGRRPALRARRDMPSGMMNLVVLFTELHGKARPATVWL